MPQHGLMAAGRKHKQHNMLTAEHRTCTGLRGNYFQAVELHEAMPITLMSHVQELNRLVQYVRQYARHSTSYR